MITPERARALLPGEVDGVLELLAVADLGTSVPSCPGWSVRDLIVHVGNVHRWVVQAMTTGDAEDPAPAVSPDHELGAWYRGVADDLLALFAETPPETPCWTFGMEPRRAAFWFRRQAHEVAMHRWDLGGAAGLDVGYDTELAADGLDEVVTIFWPRQVQLGRAAPLPVALAVAPDDIAGRWVIAGDGTGPAPDPDATVTGPAAALLLLLWGRIGLTDDRIQLHGSSDSADQVLRAGIVP